MTDVEAARRAVESGDALLVCAYENEAKCERLKLAGAISLASFERQAASVPRDREIIFYCA